MLVKCLLSKLPPVIKSRSLTQPAKLDRAGGDPSGAGRSVEGVMCVMCVCVCVCVCVWGGGGV